MSEPRFRIYIAASIDGYIATSDGRVDWLQRYASDDFGYREFAAGISTIIMGRATFEQTLGFGPWPYQGKRTLVLSTRPYVEGPSEVEQVRGNLDGMIQALRQDGDGDIWIHGGARTIGEFMRREAVDLIELFVVPVILGSGIHLADHWPEAARLGLKETHPYEGGVVKLTYTVTWTKPASLLERLETTAKAAS